MTETNYYYDENNIIEKVSLENMTICVVKGKDGDENDNVYCFDSDMRVIWRIKQVPTEIGGTARSPYVGVSYTEGSCRVIDIYGRSFAIDITNGEILSMRIVK
ncbi:hypothetical protein D6853_09500 [Butyrivibrio sp. X503]|uniref:hypothetical protein n=1 Tax=Butyrivibrio sp. X503 TaxID=2364878 RepID=UPI000EAACE2D|nr:hypothetical protein [Butyrivibrio sp. X503]RKM55770.1 hypothetical protein D6853_09500 [Butyrivibrio sp. X503]